MEKRKILKEVRGKKTLNTRKQRLIWLKPSCWNECKTGDQEKIFKVLGNERWGNSSI